METKEDVLSLRREVKKLQCALAEEEDDSKKMLLFQINNLTMDTYKKQVTHHIPCLEDKSHWPVSYSANHIMKYLDIL
jgi:hypothetical protein